MLGVSGLPDGVFCGSDYSVTLHVKYFVFISYVYDACTMIMPDRIPTTTALAFPFGQFRDSSI